MLWVTLINLVAVCLIVVIPVAVIVIVAAAAHSVGLAVLLGFLLGVPALVGWSGTGSDLSSPFRVSCSRTTREPRRSYGDSDLCGHCGGGASGASFSFR